MPRDEALNLIAEYYTLSRAQDPLTHIDRTFLHYPPGHYYSPLPDKAEVERVAGRIYDVPLPASIPGVDLRERQQLELYSHLVKYYPLFPFEEKKKTEFRYYLDNIFFCHADAFWLFSMLLHFKPKHLIEIGSGFSSCVTLDTIENFMEIQPILTFIEPDPQRLLENMGTAGRDGVTLHSSPIQDVPLDVFDCLENGDFLFIDSSHVGKIGSDVLYLLFEVLPRLASGVIIHIHDMFYPFEYPIDWLKRGWAWNEDYFVRAFLQYNNSFEILLFGNYLGKKHSQMLLKHTPVCCKNIGGSLWLRKV